MLRSLASTSSIVARASASLSSPSMNASRHVGATRTLIYSKKTKAERAQAAAVSAARASSASSSSSNTSNPYITYIHPVHIHPLSQMVLQYLQDYKSDWLMEKGLDRGLCINGDGTMKLTFPPAGAVHNGNDGILEADYDGEAEDQIEEIDGGRIWTSYDHIKKQHFISVHRHNLLLGRFMLRHHDCSGVAALYCDESSPREQVHAAVEKMIERVEQIDKKSQNASTA